MRILIRIAAEYPAITHATSARSRHKFSLLLWKFIVSLGKRQINFPLSRIMSSRKATLTIKLPKEKAIGEGRMWRNSSRVFPANTIMMLHRLFCSICILNFKKCCFSIHSLNPATTEEKEVLLRLFSSHCVVEGVAEVMSRLLNE